MFREKIRILKKKYTMWCMQNNLILWKTTEFSINKHKFGVDWCKLMKNANFGKQIENVRKYKDTRIANN